jgi:hypothetical protein
MLGERSSHCGDAQSTYLMESPVEGCQPEVSAPHLNESPARLVSGRLDYKRRRAAGPEPGGYGGVCQPSAWRRGRLPHPLGTRRRTWTGRNPLGWDRYRGNLAPLPSTPPCVPVRTRFGCYAFGQVADRPRSCVDVATSVVISRDRAVASENALAPPGRPSGAVPGLSSGIAPAWESFVSIPRRDSPPTAPQSVPKPHSSPREPWASRANYLISEGLVVPRTGIEPVTP